MCPGKENPVLVALKQMPSSTKYPIKVDESIIESDFETLLSLLYPTYVSFLLESRVPLLTTAIQWPWLCRHTAERSMDEGPMGIDPEDQ